MNNDSHYHKAYRITTNGSEYRVEFLTRIKLTDEDRWIPIGQGNWCAGDQIFRCDRPQTFVSPDKAVKFIRFYFGEVGIGKLTQDWMPVIITPEMLK